MTPKTLDKYIAKVKKQYAEEGWSLIEYQNELYKMQGEMSDQYSDGKISDAEYQKVIQKIQNAISKPELQGKKQSAPAAKSTAQKLTADQEYWMKQYDKMLSAGSITQTQYNDFVKQLGVQPAAQPATQVGMSADEKQKLLQSLQTKAINNEISKKDADKLMDKVDELFGKGATAEEAQKLLDNATKLVKAGFDVDTAFESAKSVEKQNKASAQTNKATYPELYDYLVDISGEEIDDMDAMTLTDMVEYLKKSNVDPDQAKKQLESAVDLIKNNGFTAEEAMNLAAGYKPGMKPVTQTAQPQGMSHDEYIKLWEALNKKKKSGLIDKAEYSALGDKLDKAYKDKKTVADIEKEIGCDPGTLATDEKVIKLGKELKKVYGEAEKEMQAKLKDLEKEFGIKVTEMADKLYNGEITKEAYDKWLQTQIMTKNVMKQKLDQLSGVMLNANKAALGMINGEQVSVFAENANYQAYQLTQDTGVNLMFSVYDEHTAKKLIMEKPELLPRKEVNGKKDKAWNQKQIAGAVTQALIQGEAIPKLAKRIAMQTGETNMKAMLRYARTAMTSAQNSGRMEMLHQAQGMGIKCKKRWLATLDQRTRDTHAALDGTVVGVDDKFPNGLMYPGDPEGPAGEVYNCRCTLIYEYDGFPNDPTTDQRLMYEEWDETVPVKKKDKNGKEYEAEKTIHHRESRMITDMNYDEWKAAKEGSKLNELNAAKVLLANAQKAVIQANIKEDKIYEGLWKDPVTLKDYPDKKAGIQAKKDYYAAEIQKYKDAQANGASWATDEKIKELEKKKKLLNEFEKRGELIEKRDKALADVQDIYSQVGFGKQAAAPSVAKKAKNTAKKAATAAGGTSTGAAGQMPAGMATAAKQGQFAPNAWDASTKKQTKLYSNRHDADKALRPDLDADWDKLTDREKYAVWEYTRNSNPMNKSLSGYHETWSRGNFIGIENTEWGHEDKYRTISTPGMQKFAKPDGHVGYKRAITDLTLAMEKTPLKRDMWLVRGSDQDGLAGMMEGGGMNFNQVRSLFNGGHSLAEIKKALVGQVGRNHAFTSTGIAKDAGFSGNIKYEIFAPKGTKCVYAEPQSYYGSTSSGSIYKKGQAYGYVGGEAEVIVQRGTAYRISDIRQSGRNYTVVMEIVDQPDYFVNGDEDTYNGGKTRHSR